MAPAVLAGTGGARSDSLDRDQVAQAMLRNTGPTGQHALQTLMARLAAQAAIGQADGEVATSRSQGSTLAKAVLLLRPDRRRPESA